MRFVAHVASGNPHRNPGPHRTLHHLIELADRGTPRAIPKQVRASYPVVMPAVLPDTSTA